jgi:DNA polymerase-3 subunit gamma/tau
MAYQVIARRWRPQKFDDVVSQDHVSKTLQNSIRNGRISHAYIFAGPRGVGKTTSARIFAKSLNCINGPTPEPCGVCENCIEIRDGRSFDVIEIDGASNNSVDDIRDLREKVSFAPAKSRYKIYIIDEVHMLSTSAFNALLKTLEEPPAHVVFIMATTELHKLPETILSRCQKFFFRKMGAEVIAAHLSTIAKSDGFTLDEAALYTIARAAGGSMRDAQSLLEQVLSFSNGAVSRDIVLSQLGLVSLDSYIVILRSIAANDSAALVKAADSAVDGGADITRYAAGFLDILRALRLVSNGIDIRAAAGFSPEEYASIGECAKLFTDADFSSFFRICVSLQNDLRYCQNEKAVLEMALFDMKAAKQTPSLAAIIKKLEGVSVSAAPAQSGGQTAANTAAAVSSSQLAPDLQTLTPPSAAVAPHSHEPDKSGQSSSLAEETHNAAGIAQPPSQAQAADADAENDIPPPDDSLAGSQDLSEFDIEHPVIEKLKEVFHGQIIEKEKR